MEAFAVQNKKCNCLHEVSREIDEIKNLMSYFHEKMQNIEKVNGDMLEKINLLVQAQLSTLMQPTNQVLLNTLQQLPHNMRNDSTNSMGGYNNSMRNESTSSMSSYNNSMNNCEPLHSIPVDDVFPRDRNDCNLENLESVNSRHNMQEVQSIHEAVNPVAAHIKSLITTAGYGDTEVAKVCSIHSHVLNRAAFARQLSRIFFHKSELVATWYDTRDITRITVELDSKRLALIKALVLFKFPLECGETEDKVWKTVMVKIKAMCRNYRANHRKLLIVNN